MADKLVDLMTMFKEESRHRDEEIRRGEERCREMKQLIQSLNSSATEPVIGNKGTDLAPELIRQIPEFSHDPETGKTFSKWIGRFEAVLIDKGAKMSDQDKIQVLASKLDMPA